MNQSQSTPAASGPGSGSQQPLLALKGVTKSFGAVEALKDVALEIYPGEVVGLVGDNGAGKSTLIKSISGAQPPDAGEIRWEGHPVRLPTPQAATALGIATVYQDLALAENLDVVANLFLGQEVASTLAFVSILDEVAMEQKSVELLSSLGVTTLRSVRTEVASLSGGQRQAVAIARSLLGEPKLVLLDEPTAALGIVQTAQILKLIGTLRERGLAVVVISHNLANVFEVCDRIAVLRLGRMAATFKAEDSTREQIVASMTGADVKERVTEETAAVSAPDTTIGTAPAEAVDGFSVRRALAALARGDLASVRVIIGIAVIWTIFQIANDRFLSAVNLSNLTLQIAAVATISIGVVLVLLLGEIDLSVGAVSGLAAGVMGVLSVQHEWAPVLGILAGLGVGVAIGFFNGFMVTNFGIPSFVVTLAGLLAWQGALLYVLGDTGSVNLPPSVITDLTTTFFEPAVGWILAAVAIAFVAGSQFLARRRRVAAGLEPGHLTGAILRLILIAAAILGATAILNADRGVPLAALIVIVLLSLFTFITERTRYGRHLFAVGGNEEAARRAGIRVKWVKISVFTLASTLAAAGGILAASRGLAVNQQAGSGDVLLLAIAGPVIAGTSLFGGRGYIWSALLGAVVIGSISNGMDLLALDSDIKFMITGAVLLGAVTIDALTRQRRQQAR